MEHSNAIFLVLIILFCVYTLVNGIEKFDALKPIRRTKTNSSEKCKEIVSCEVQTGLGEIIGKKLKTSLGDTEDVEFCAYLGIPYGKAPIANLRFKPPVAYGPWKGALKANTYGKICIQFSALLVPIIGVQNWPQSEDCLTLNVHTPNRESCGCQMSKIPVLVYIYGGAFTEGDSTNHIYGPNMIMNECIVLVTFNYRIGPLGFLSLRTPNYSGNMGLKDQQLAIKWVKDNIASFGGDPNRITIFGESAGGSSVGLHTMNAKSKMNFNQVFMMSSTPLNYYAQMKSDNHSDVMIELATRKGVFISNMDELIEFIKNVDAKSLVDCCSHKGGFGLTFDTDWAPIVERPGDMEAFITRDPLDYYENEVNEFPTVLTEMTLEYLTFLLLYAFDPLSIITRNNLTLFLPVRDLNQDACAEELRPLIKDIKKFYFGGHNVDFETFRQLLRMTSDMNFAFHIQKTAALLSQRSTAPIYFQVLNFRTPLNLATSLPVVSSVDGTAHGEDICYYFNCAARKASYDDTVNYRDIYQTYMEASFVRQVLVDFLVSFATNGKPSSTTASFDDSLYPTFGSDPYVKQQFVKITKTGTPTAGINPNWGAFNLWTQVEREVDRIRKLPCNRITDRSLKPSILNQEWQFLGKALKFFGDLIATPFG